MEWIVEKPVLYLMEKSRMSDVYEMWLGIASVPNKYALCAYLGLDGSAIEAETIGETKVLAKSVAKGIYADSGVTISAIAIAQGNFKSHITNLGRSWTEISLDSDDQPGQLLTAYQGRTRPVNEFSDKDLDDLLAMVRKRQDGVRVKWGNCPKVELLPDIRKPEGSVLWG